MRVASSPPTSHFVAMTVDSAPPETSAARLERRFRLAVVLSLLAHALILVGALFAVVPHQADPPTIAAELIVEAPRPPPPAPPAPPPDPPAQSPPPQQPQIATQPPAPPRPSPSPSNPANDGAQRAAMPAFTVRPNDFQRVGDNWLPVYPEAARANGLQGRVIVTVDIDVAGRPTRVVVGRSSGHANLDEAARQAVRFWKFRPPRYNGRPVTATVDIPFDFKL